MRALDPFRTPHFTQGSQLNADMSDSPLIELRSVSLNYGNHAALDRLTLSVRRGEFVVLHGSTGCGKSTVLHLIAGLIKPSEGEVIVAGDRVDLFDDAQRRWLRRSMGLMMQEG